MRQHHMFTVVYIIGWKVVQSFCSITIMWLMYRYTPTSCWWVGSVLTLNRGKKVSEMISVVNWLKKTNVKEEDTQLARWPADLWLINTLLSFVSAGSSSETQTHVRDFPFLEVFQGPALTYNQWAYERVLRRQSLLRSARLRFLFLFLANGNELRCLFVLFTCF